MARPRKNESPILLATPARGSNIGLESWPGIDQLDRKTVELADRAIRRLSVGSFADAANSGLEFQECLAVVCRTGMALAARIIAKMD